MMTESTMISGMIFNGGIAGEGNLQLKSNDGETFSFFGHKICLRSHPVGISPTTWRSYSVFKSIRYDTAVPTMTVKSSTGMGTGSFTFLAMKGYS